MQLKLIDRNVNKVLREHENSPSNIEYRDTEIKGFSLIVRESGKHSFCYRYRNADNRWKKFTLGTYGGDLTCTQARAIASTKSGEVKSGIDIQDEKIRTRQEAEQRSFLVLKTFFEEKYKPYCLSHMKAGEERARVINSSFVRIWPDKPLGDINVWLMTNWRKEKLKAGLTHGGVNRSASALKALLNRAVEWGFIEANPLAELKPLKEDSNRIVRYLTTEEEASLRHSLDARQDQQRVERSTYNQWLVERHREPLQDLSRVAFTDYLKPMVLLALNTGMRRGELFDLTINDVDLKQRHVVIRGSSAKSGKTRVIPLNKESNKILAVWIQESKPKDLVFPSPVSGKRFDNINKSWKRLLEEAQLSDFRFHDLRHTFASNLVMTGSDIYTVSELLGHSDVTVTKRYAHLAPEHKSKAVELLNDRRKS